MFNVYWNIMRVGRVRVMSDDVCSAGRRFKSLLCSER